VLASTTKLYGDSTVWWESLSLGAVIVLERGKTGLERICYKLPVSLVDSMQDLTLELIQQAYVEAIYRAEEWEYQRLAHTWFERLIFEISEAGSVEPLQRLHPKV
jgi:hypothetical protein